MVGCVQENVTCTTPLNLVNPTPTYENHPNNPDPNRSVKHPFNASKITVEVYPNKDAEVNFTLQLLNNPLDLYFLMDFTHSMRTTVDQLYKVSEELGKQIAKLTSDYQVGFGTYVDKCVPPFAKYHEYYGRERMPYSTAPSRQALQDSPSPSAPPSTWPGTLLT